ncbi:ATP-binding protein [Actinomadura litoris]|uniref:ATP-binding protein n=1 Tax=Actinomadura litoris TaxID=2678616 RepID=UPI001FA7DCD6|nr:ATP-binding protein [Actinomadura litoris]
MSGCGGLVVVGAITLPGVKKSVRHARLFLRDVMPDGRPVDDVVTVGSETVCNAIAHTASGDGGRVTVSLLAGDDVCRVEVADDGADGRRPHVRPEDGSESGRGMRVVEALAERWGFREDGDRTVVWAEFSYSSGNPDRGLSPDPPMLAPTAIEEDTRWQFPRSTP